MTYNLIEHTFKEIYILDHAMIEKRNLVAKMIDTMTAIMAPFQLFFLFNKGLFQYHPQYYRFLFWHFLSFSSELSIFSIIVWQISWPYLYNCTPITYSDNIFFVGQNILLLNVMVSICSYRNLGFSIWINMCLYVCAWKSCVW